MKAAAPDTDLFLIVGAPNSSNSRRLVEVAQRGGAKSAHLVQSSSEIPWHLIDDSAAPLTIGLSAGASAPEVLVQEIIEQFRGRYQLSVELAETVKEDQEFLVMRELRDIPLEQSDMAFVNG